jgi:transposase
MSCTDLGHPVPTTTRSEDNIVFAALELSRKSWLVATSSPGEERISKRVVTVGDGPGLLALLGKLRETAERRLGRAVRVVVIQEAGLDGFWLHRFLEATGIESHVVDPASIAVDRRKRRRKTDAIDAEGLLRALMAWTRGERRVCSMVRPPSPAEEDRRRLCREREALVTERIRHTNRIKGLLAGQGVLDFDPLRPKHRARLDEVRTGDGRPLPPCLLAEIRRQLGRLDVVVRDLATVEAERNGLVGVRSTDRSAPRAAEAVESGGVPEAVAIPVAPEIGPAVAPEEAAPGAASEMAPAGASAASEMAPAGASAASEMAPAEPAALLMRLKGIGPEFAAVLWLEALFRSFGNRRQIAAYAGLAPVPWQSGGIERDQGIAKAGNPRLRKTMIQVAWLWIRHQPGSAISQWFARRVGTARGRVRRIAIVAVARKLLVALWRYVTPGVVPEGAVLKA